MYTVARFSVDQQIQGSIHTDIINTQRRFNKRPPNYTPRTRASATVKRTDTRFLPHICFPESELELALRLLLLGMDGPLLALQALEDGRLDMARLGDSERVYG